jgi:hypothetical protein
LTEEYAMFDRYLPAPVFRKALSRAATLAGLVAGLLMAATATASTQSACLPHGKLVDLLDGRYSEQRVAVGLESNGRLFEIFAADDGSTWTMVVTTPNGASCVVAAGLEWQEPEKEEPDPET